MRILVLIMMLNLLAGCERIETEIPRSVSVFHADRMVLPPSPDVVDAASRGGRVELGDAFFAKGAVVAQLGFDLVALGLVNQAESAGDPAVARRKVVYTAQVTVRVSNREAAHEAVVELIELHGGFIQRSTLDEITFRVRPDSYAEVMEALGGLGEIAAREERSDDVTDQFFDLELRLAVAETSRKRLMEILETADKTKDILEVERDLRRLTEEIERMKGQFRQLNDRIDWATITVRLSEKAPPVALPVVRAGSPFAWIKTINLDSALAELPADAPLHGGRLAGRFYRGPNFELAGASNRGLPASFLALAHTKNELVAASARGDRLRALRVETPQRGDLDFWSDSVAEELGGYRGYEIDSVEDFELDRAGLVARAIHASAQHGGERWSYDVWLVTKSGRGREVLIIDFARRAEEEAEHLNEIEAAVRGVRM